VKMAESIPPEKLLGAYAQGIFPMAQDGELLWFSPVKRGVIPIDERFCVPKGLKRALKKNPFEVKVNTAFREVMEGCAAREETWIDDVIYESYCKLFSLGFAHSFECWDSDGLQGGLYGVALGKAFFGESMFSRKTDASKIALVHLVEYLRVNDYTLLDTQWMTDHLRQFGGFEMTRDVYIEHLIDALAEVFEW
jgi:leucyl/phenylalanyl-tRNA---protein transferase